MLDFLEGITPFQWFMIWMCFNALFVIWMIERKEAHRKQRGE